ncbi:hypothetical protein Tco_1085459, partial [Tanacetum coccineum]
MSTQQDMYAAGSENRPHMLNKDNYVSWSSRLLLYAKSKTNGKLIYNSIMHGPYVRRMIPEPGDLDREVPIAETFHEQTDDELTDKEIKQMEVDDQAIQTILMGLIEDTYAAVDSCETAQEIWLRVQQMMKDYTQLYDFLKFNQVENVENQNGYNAMQNVRNQVVQNAVQNLGVQNVGNKNGLIVVLGIANQNTNQNGNGNVVPARAECNGNGNNENQLLIAQKEDAGIQLQAKDFDLMAAEGDLDDIEEVNANCILMANLQQASTLGSQTDK